MGLLGSGWDDPQSSAIMALAGGLLQGNVGAGLLGANSAFQDAKQNALKSQFMQAQMANLNSEVETRKAALAKQQSILDLFNPKPGGSMMTTQPGQLGSGSFGTMQPPAGMPAIPQAAPAGQSRVGSMSLDQLAQLKALGLDMTDVYKLGQPDMQVSNGFAYDKNKVPPGFLPGITVGQNGMAMQTTPDGRGGVSVNAPNGAIPAYAAFRNADESAKAAFDLQTITPKGAVNPVATTRLALLQAGGQQSAPAGIGGVQIPPEVQRGRDQESLGYIAQDLNNAKAALTEGVRKGAPAAQLQGLQEAVGAAQRDYDRRLKQASGGPAGVELQSPATAKLNDSIAVNEAGQVNEAYTKAAAAKSALPALWNAQELLKGGTFTGMGADAKMNVLRALGSLGISIPDSVANSQQFDATISQVAGKQLKSIVGSNGISNSDVKLVQGMFGTRGQEAAAVKYLVDKAVESNFREINNYNGMLPGLQAGGGQTTLGKVDPPTRQEQGMPKIKNDADFNALPSGSVFIDPFGKQRRKQ